MKFSRYIAFILAVLMLALAFSSIPMKADAITDVQDHFLRVIGSIARANYYEYNVLASLTIGQGIYESGWGGSALAVGGRNLFGIKAFSTWTGNVFNQRDFVFYDNYTDYLFVEGQSHVNTTSAWRAHASWAESAETHNKLFAESSRYAPIVGEKNYKTAANLLVSCGYCTDNGYANSVVKMIENYDLTKYDDITPDTDGIVALVANEERKFVDIGETFSVDVTYYPAEKTPSKVTWASDNKSVATVDKNGKVTAINHGTALITATLPNGREACCIVYVDCNATVMKQNVTVRSAASSTASSKGTIVQGAAVKVTSETPVSDSSGNKFYAVKGVSKDGKTITGYVEDDYIYLSKRNPASISVVKNDVTLTVNEKYTVYNVVTPADAENKTLTWTSSDSAIAAVDKNGVITAKKIGKATVTATAVGGAKTSITVNVASAKRNYNGLISAYKTVSVRSAASATASKAGTFYFMDKVTVVGEPVGIYYKVTGKNSSGTTVTGYVSSAYVRIISDDVTVEKKTAEANIGVYASATTGSRKYGDLAEGTEYAIIGKSGEWSYVVGLTNPSSLCTIYGYARLETSQDPELPSVPSLPTETTVKAYKAVTTSRLNIRSGAGTSYSSYGIIENGAEIAVIDSSTSGWYKVAATINSKQVIGYCSSDYVKYLYTGKTSSRLNLRTQASTAGTSLTIIPLNATVTIIGESVNGWYSVKYSTYSGYSSASYINVSGKISVTVTVPVEFSCTNSSYKIADGYLTGVSPKTTATTFLGNFKGKVSVVNSSGKALSATDKVGTGCKLMLEVNGTKSVVAYVAIKGDIDGNGEATSSDYVLLKRYVMKTYTQDAAQMKASDIDENSNISSADYILLKRMVMGTYVAK